jgi:hypothetical protein
LGREEQAEVAQRVATLEISTVFEENWHLEESVSLQERGYDRQVRAYVGGSQHAGFGHRFLGFVRVGETMATERSDVVRESTNVSNN